MTEFRNDLSILWRVAIKIFNLNFFHSSTTCTSINKSTFLDKLSLSACFRRSTDRVSTRNRFEFRWKVKQPRAPCTAFPSQEDRSHRLSACNTFPISKLRNSPDCFDELWLRPHQRSIIAARWCARRYQRTPLCVGWGKEKININCFYQACFRGKREKIAHEKFSVPSQRERFSFDFRLHSHRDAQCCGSIFRERKTQKGKKLWKQNKKS